MKAFLSGLRPGSRRQEPVLAVAERFLCEVEPLSGIELPLPPLPAGARQIEVLVRRPADGLIRRVSWTVEGAHSEPTATIAFSPIAASAQSVFDLAIAFDGGGFSTDALLGAFDSLYDVSRAPIVLGGIVPPTREGSKPVVERFWCDANGLFVEGTIALSAETLSHARLMAGDDVAPLEIVSAGAHACRFTGYTAWRAGTPVFLVFDADGTTKAHGLELPRGPLAPMRWKGRNEWDETLAKAMEDEAVDDSNAASSFKHFVRSADAPEMTVAEIGGRVVGDASQAMKRFMPKAGRFLSVDIHASEHVDVVGDAHYLDDLLGAESIDALFSLSVMEHLAYPWLFAAAVNRSLKPGGLVFQSTPHTWPLHETPNDFWRFSDEALKILFGPEMGFEVIDAGMVNRIWLYPEERRGAFVDMPFNHGYGNAYIYARKVRTVERDAVRWPVDPSLSDSLAKKYPSADRASREPRG